MKRDLKHFISTNFRKIIEICHYVPNFMTSTLYDTVQRLNAEYDPASRTTDLPARRQQACIEAQTTILAEHEPKILEAARQGRKTTRIYEWGYADKLQFCGIYLRDLLNRATLLAMLQTQIDTLHGADRFKIYHGAVGFRDDNQPLSARRYAVYVSWEHDDFERIDQMIQSHLEKTRENTVQVPSTDRSPNVAGPKLMFPRGGFRATARRGRSSPSETTRQAVNKETTPVGSDSLRSATQSM
jgi:hypothetical protein